MKVIKDWINQWESDKDRRIQENELYNAINEYVALKSLLKTVLYKIEKLEEHINELQDRLP